MHTTSGPAICWLAINVVHLRHFSSSANTKCVAGPSNCDNSGQPGKTGRTGGSEAVLKGEHWSKTISYPNEKGRILSIFAYFIMHLS